jgi:hypothetical protein
MALVIVLIPFLHGLAHPLPCPNQAGPGQPFLDSRPNHCARLEAGGSTGGPSHGREHGAPLEVAETNEREFEEDDKAFRGTSSAASSGASHLLSASFATIHAPRSHLHLGARLARGSILRC